MQETYGSGAWIENLPPQIRDEVMAATTTKNCADGELIYSAGDTAEASYIIEQGKVKLCLLTPEGKEFIIALWSEGECFGEQGVIDNSPRLSSAYAEGPVRLRALSKENITRLRKQHNEVSEALLLMVNYRLRLIMNHMYRVLLSPLQQQLAARIYMAAKSSGIETPSGTEIQIKLTQDDLAKLTGASRQSINKELKELQRLNILETNSKKITVLDMPYLEASFNLF